MTTCTQCDKPIWHRNGHTEYGEMSGYEYRVSTLMPASGTCDSSPTGYHYPEVGTTWLSRPFDRWPSLMAWAAEVFTNETPDFLAPAPVRRALTRLYSSYGSVGLMPGGICDPMYIANVIAHECGWGDGESHFSLASVAP
jgi:hypothetical protein